MDRSADTFRRQYPARAVLLVAGAGLLLAFNLVVGFLFMALVPPLIPVYVCILFAGTSLVEGALRYAQRVSIRQPAVMLRAGKHEEKFAERSPAARSA
jgi:hypothetical protein